MAQNSSYHGVIYKYSELMEAVIEAFFTVYGALGYGFLEKVYVNAGSPVSNGIETRRKR